MASEEKTFIAPSIKSIRSNRASYHQGSTLIETLISVCTVSIGALAIVSLQTNLTRSTTLAGQQAEALLLAEDKLEDLRHFNGLDEYSNIKTNSDNHTGTNALFNRNWTVTAFANPDYKIIEMIVSWLQADGTTNQVKLVSRITYEDPQYLNTLLENKPDDHNSDNEDHHKGQSGDDDDDDDDEDDDHKGQSDDDDDDDDEDNDRKGQGDDDDEEDDNRKGQSNDDDDDDDNDDDRKDQGDDDDDEDNDRKGQSDDDDDEDNDRKGQSDDDDDDDDNDDDDEDD